MVKRNKDVTTMKLNHRAIMAMISSALHGNDEIYCRDELAEIETTPDFNALLFHLADGRTFQIDVTEVV